MKKILFAAVAALAFVGCAQNEEIETLGDKAEINFGTIVSKTTRAGVTDIDSLKKSGFKVSAYNTGATEMSGVAANGLGKAFIDNAANTFDSGTNKWNMTGGPYYWPLTDYVQFFAYANVTGATYGLDAADKYPTIAYSIEADASKQVDFVVAQLNDQKKPVTNAPIALKFNHALTQVNFSAKGSNANLNYKITSVAIAGVAASGEYSFETNEWTPTAADVSGSYTYPTVADAPVSGTTVTPLDQVNGALMLMPQTLPSDAKIKVSYKVYDANKVQIDEVTDAEVKLTGTDAWGAGKKIRYTLTLSSEGATMSFAPEVGPWNTEEDVVAPKEPTPAA